MLHFVTKITVIYVSEIQQETGGFRMFKKSTVHSCLLSTARALYVFVTVAAVFGVLAVLNVGGH